MTFAHESIAALPVSGDADKAAIRALLTRRVAYALGANESAQDFVAVDPATGILPLYLIQNNVVFQYDSIDTTTAHDGVTCLVSSDGKRYKSDVVALPWSVLTKGTTAQPVSPAPSVGDRYLLPTGATGTDWAGHDDEIAIYTQRGWVFATYPVGKLLHVEDETAFYHRNAETGDWVGGVGDIVLASNTVPRSALIGTGIRSIDKVENQTTNIPPSSPAPTVPTAYIIGSSPTGAWAGKAGQIAICETDGVWTYYVPAIGDRVYDKSLGNDVRWDGSAWLSSVGVWIDYKESIVSGAGTLTTTTTTPYVYSPTSGPTTASRRKDDDNTISHTAKVTGTRMRLRWSAYLTWNSSAQAGAGLAVLAVYRDNEANAIAWKAIARDVTQLIAGEYMMEFLISAPDTSVHTYKIGILNAYSGGNQYFVNTISNSQITIEEKG